MTNSVGRTVLYLHGFASSPRGRKVEALETLFRPEGIVLEAPDLNVPSFSTLDFDAMLERARARARECRPGVIAGSSLGALVALALSRGNPGPPLVLIAPAIGFGPRWTEKLPAGDPLSFFHHGENRECPIHRRFFEEMALRKEDEPPAVPVTVLMGDRDESVPPDAVREVWNRWEASGRLPPGSGYVAIPEGDHGLTAFVPAIAGAIRGALGA